MKNDFENKPTGNTENAGNGIVTFDLEGDGAVEDIGPEELAKMKKENPPAYREILKISINRSLDKSSKIIDKKALIYGRNQRELGKLLKDARRTFNKHSEFMVWLRENFSQHHLRTLEEAMYLAGLGKFAEKFEGISKNSMLALGRIRYEDEVVEFMEQYPPPVVNPEDNLTPRKNYAHSVIIYKRFLDREVSLTPEQATAIATTCNKPLEINAINIVADQINEQPTNELKTQFIDEWIKGGCLIQREKPAKKSPSLNGIIAQLKDITGKSKTR